MKRKNIMAVCLLLVTFGAQAQTISTIAGNGTGGYSGDGGVATAAEVNNPNCVAYDAAGNIYIADYGNKRVRKVTPSGAISTFAGTGIGTSAGDGGAATGAAIGTPVSVSVDAAGNVYIADDANNNVRKVNTAGVISTIAGTGAAGYNGDGIAATTAKLNAPYSVAVDAAGNVYIADGANSRVRMVNTSGMISTFAGGGSGTADGIPASTALLGTPFALAIEGSNVYISDANTNLVRKVDASGMISTVAGGGTSTADGTSATAAALTPNGIAIDATGNLYIADGTSKIRKVNTSGIISTVAGDGTSGFAGDGSMATSAELNAPTDVKVDAVGNLFIADYSNNRIRKVTSSGTTSVKQTPVSDGSIVIFPNPNTGAFTIKGSLNSITDETVSVVVMNMLGQLVYSKDAATSKGMINTQVSIPVVTNGIYFLKICSGNQSTNYRLMIEK